MIQKFSKKELQRLGCTEEEINLIMTYQRKFPILKNSVLMLNNCGMN